MLSTRWLGIHCTGLRPSTLAGQTLPRTDMPPPAAERRGQAVQRVHDEAMLYLTSIGKRYLGEIELAGYVELSDDTADTIIKFIDEHDIQGVTKRSQVSPGYRSQCRLRTGAASAKCRAGTGARVSPSYRNLTTSICAVWSGRRDSNPRPSAWEASAVGAQTAERRNWTGSQKRKLQCSFRANTGWGG